MRFNLGDIPGYEPVLPPPQGEPAAQQLGRLKRIVEHFGAFDPEAPAPPGLAQMWADIERTLAPGVAPGGVDFKALDVRMKKVPFEAVSKGALEDDLLFDGNSRRGDVGDPVNGMAGGAAKGFPPQASAARASADKGPRASGLPSVSPLPEVLDVTNASYILINRYGSAKAALEKVIDARGGDHYEVPFAQRVAAVKEIEVLLDRPLKNPRVDSSVDYDLMYMDHFLNAQGGVASGWLRPDAGDGWGTRKLKTVGREGVAVGGTVITTGYEVFKMADQKLGLSLGKIFNYDFKDPMCSKASWKGIKAGLSGIWYGTFDDSPKSKE